MSATSTQLRTIAGLLRAAHVSGFAADLERIAIHVQRMEVTLDEITAEAINAEADARRAAYLGGSVVALGVRQ